MSGHPTRYPIVVALDETEYAEVVLEHALDQAARHDHPVLHFLRVVDSMAKLEPARDELARMVLEGLDAFWLASPACPTRVHSRVGKPVEEIANLVAEVRAKLLVIGRFGTKHKSRSIVDAIVERTACATLVVGLASDDVDSVPQCPDCVDLREQSDGEVWFCAAHTSARGTRLSQLVDGPSTDARGGVW